LAAGLRPNPLGEIKRSPDPRSEREGARREGDGKIYSKYHCQRPHFSGQNDQKNVWRPGSARTRWERLSAPQTQDAKGKGARRRKVGRYIQNITARDLIFRSN
jgi:hypothetical protein